MYLQLPSKGSYTHRTSFVFVSHEKQGLAELEVVGRLLGRLSILCTVVEVIYMISEEREDPSKCKTARVVCLLGVSL